MCDLPHTVRVSVWCPPHCTSKCVITPKKWHFFGRVRVWYTVVGISKKNHQISLVFAKNLWSWTLDPIPYENTSQKFQLWTPGHISGSRMNFWPDSILGGSLGCREPRKTQILMAQGSPLAGQLTKVGILLVDPFRVHRTRSGSSWYLKG